MTSNHNKDFDHYAYFVSKAKNYGCSMKSEIKQKDLHGQMITLQPAVRIEFNNGMLRLDKKANKEEISFLRKKIEDEKDKGPKARMLYEEIPSSIVMKEDHDKALGDKNKEIEDLKKQIEEKEEETKKGLNENK